MQHLHKYKPHTPWSQWHQSWALKLSLQREGKGRLFQRRWWCHERKNDGVHEPVCRHHVVQQDHKKSHAAAFRSQIMARLAQPGYPGQRMWCPGSQDSLKIWWWQTSHVFSCDVDTSRPVVFMCLCLWRDSSVKANLHRSVLEQHLMFFAEHHNKERRWKQERKDRTKPSCQQTFFFFFTAGLINRSDLQSGCNDRSNLLQHRKLNPAAFGGFSSLWMKEQPLCPKTNNRNEKTHRPDQDLYWYPVSSVMELQHAEMLYVRIKKSEKVLSKRLDFFKYFFTAQQAVTELETLVNTRS